MTQPAQPTAASAAPASTPVSTPVIATAATTSQPVSPKQYTPITAGQQQKPVPAVTTQQVGHTQALSSEPAMSIQSANGIGFNANIQTSSSAPAPKPTTPDPAVMSAPEAKSLLPTINNAKFDEVFVGIATGETKTSIGAARKKHSTGAELVQRTLDCLEYCGLVSAKNANGQRSVTETISAEEAEVVMGEIKNIIRGAAA